MEAVVHPTQRIGRRSPRAALATAVALGALVAGLLTPTAASATPATAAEARTLLQRTAQELTVLDEQVHEAALTVEAQQQAADDAVRAATEAQDALAAFEPRLRAIAQTGFTGRGQSRVAAFLTSGSAGELIQQMTTLDVIAAHTNGVIGRVAAAQRAAQEAQSVADQAAASASTALVELADQQAEVRRRATAYEADLSRLSATERAVVTTAVAGRSITVDPDTLPRASSGQAAAAIQGAMAKIGSPYVWGASGPNGFDCSGLTSYAYGLAGVSLPHSSRAQANLGPHVSRSELQPGDLVIFYNPISHVGIYIGNGMMVHARTFGHPVAVTSIDQGGFRFGVRLAG